MALPDYSKTALGTPIIWGEAGATGISLTVTKTAAVNALANAAGWMGAGADLGSDWDQDYLVQLIVETGTAPTAGNTVELYLAWSHDNVNWPGKVTGSSASYTSPSTNKLQLGLPAVVLVATADTNTTLIQQPNLVRARARYVVPVFVNLLGQAIRSQGTAANNNTRAVLTPLLSKVVD